MKIGTIIAREGSNAVKMHRAPGLNEQVLLSIPLGEKVVINTEANEWCQIIYNGLTGYVLKNFLQETNISDIVLTDEQRKTILDNINNILAILEEVL